MIDFTALECCGNCEDARRAVPEGYVACILWTQNRNIPKMFDSGINQAAEGWAYLYQSPDSKGSDTATGGLITNYCILVKRSEVCRFYKKGGKRLHLNQKTLSTPFMG